jgi:hypothetical protein
MLEKAPLKQIYFGLAKKKVYREGRAPPAYPFDLHVLGTPPVLVLNQDQLSLMYDGYNV